MPTKNRFLAGATLLSLSLSGVNFLMPQASFAGDVKNSDLKAVGTQACAATGIPKIEVDAELESVDDKVRESGTFVCEKKYLEATKSLKEAADKLPKSTLLAYWLGDLNYMQSKYEEALTCYANAENLIANQKGTLTPEGKALKLATLRGQTACFLRLKKYPEALATSRTANDLTKEIFGAGDINYGWSLFTLSEALQKTGNQAESQKVFAHAIWIFRRVNFDRLIAEYKIKNGKNIESDPKLETLRQRSWKAMFGTTNNKNMPSDLMDEKINPVTTFCKTDVGLPNGLSTHTEAPGWVWANPELPPSGLILCVHGLGLHHRSFDSFAKEMTKYGFVVIAFDVRGFGSYISNQGQEKLDLNACVDDLFQVTKELRNDYQDLPIFMLGESMGGAIALRFAALHPELLDGIVCSVPAGKRYKAGTTALTVALHLVSDPNKPFAIGKHVVAQASSQASIRSRWENDPSSRLDLSAKELVQFQKFMNQNTEFAKKITHTPVLLFQGDEDRLVKKKATYDLFNALASKQKTLVIVGGAEHLIFEAPKFKSDITYGVIGWLQSHGEQCEFNPAEALKNKAKSDANKAKSDAKKIKDDSKTDKIEKKKTSAS